MERMERPESRISKTGFHYVVQVPEFFQLNQEFKKKVTEANIKSIIFTRKSLFIYFIIDSARTTFHLTQTQVMHKVNV